MFVFSQDKNLIINLNNLKNKQGIWYKMIGFFFVRIRLWQDIHLKSNVNMLLLR